MRVTWVMIAVFVLAASAAQAAVPAVQKGSVFIPLARAGKELNALPRQEARFFPIAPRGEVKAVPLVPRGQQPEAPPPELTAHAEMPDVPPRANAKLMDEDRAKLLLFIFGGGE